MLVQVDEPSEKPVSVKLTTYCFQISGAVPFPLYRDMDSKAAAV